MYQESGYVSTGFQVIKIIDDSIPMIHATGAPTGAKKQHPPQKNMKRLATILALIVAFTLSSRADEVFTAIHNTGTQTSYSQIDLLLFDNTAYMTGIGSNFNLIFANWDAGRGYASIDIDTNNATGWYNVGTVNSTGQTIWAVLN